MLLDESIYYFTPYTVISQNTEYILSAAPMYYIYFSNHIKIFRSFSDSEGRLRGPVLQYSISSTIGGFQRRPNKIHFENNTPFAVFKEVTKVIEVNLLIFNLTINRFHIGEILISKNFINLPMKERPLRVNILELTSVLTIEILVKINYSQ